MASMIPQRTRLSIRQLKLDNPHKIIIGHMNINYVRNKFQGLRYLIE